MSLPTLLGPGDVVGMFDDDFHQFGGSFADGVQQRFLDTLEADLLHQQFDDLHRFTVDCEVQRAAAHVVDTVDVDTVDVQCQSAVVEGLTDDWNVTEGRRVEKHSLLVRQLADTSSLDD